jgi:hypothetical protein
MKILGRMASRVSASDLGERAMTTVEVAEPT